MKRTLGSPLIVVGALIMGQLGCSTLVGADFDVHLRPSDAAADSTRNVDPRSIDAADVASTAFDVGTALDASKADAAIDQGADATRGDAPLGVDVPPTPDGPAPDAPRETDSAGLPDAGTPDALEDGGVSIDDANTQDHGGGSADDVMDEDGYVPPPQPEPRPEGGIGPTGITGGFVGTGIPAQSSTSTEVRGHIISNGTIAGRTSAGISIEGRFR